MVRSLLTLGSPSGCFFYRSPGLLALLTVLHYLAHTVLHNFINALTGSGASSGVAGSSRDVF